MGGCVDAHWDEDYPQMSHVVEGHKKVSGKAEEEFVERNIPKDRA